MLFGIHFAEVGMLSLKVQEAGAWANWEATGRRVMDLEADNTAPFDRLLAGPDAVGPAAAWPRTSTGSRRSTRAPS